MLECSELRKTVTLGINLSTELYDALVICVYLELASREFALPRGATGEQIASRKLKACAWPLARNTKHFAWPALIYVYVRTHV